MAALAAYLGVGPTWSEMSTTTTVALGLSALPAIYVSYYLLGPYIDNWLGILTGRDLRYFMATMVSGQGLRELVEARAGSCKWAAQHEGRMWTSVVQGEVLGETFRWEVSSVPPRPWLRPGIYITPLNRRAAELVPELLPAGVTDLRFVPISHYASGVIYDIAQPDKASEWHAHVFANVRLKPFDRPHE
jgi:hypothetical protein